MTTTASNVEYGDRNVAIPNEILRSLVGSGVHGIAIQGTDDRDEMGVFIEPPDYVIGTRLHRDDYTFRTQPEGARSGPGDLDLTVYTLRKYLRLAAKGNPTALLPLFAAETDLVKCTDLGRELRNMRTAFLSNQAVRRFLGYMHSQHERMLGGGKRNRVPNRPELIEQYGWDVKFGSHALRLAMQGYEIASTGTLTLPLRSYDCATVLGVKHGHFDRVTVSLMVSEYERMTRHLLDTHRTPLPDQPNWNRINHWSVSAHLRHWDTE